MNTEIRVLIVEDADVLRIGMERFVKLLGFAHVASDRDGLHAYERLIFEGNYGLVITDNNMPLMTGIQLTQKIRATPILQHVRVIMTSGEELARDAMNAGVDAFFKKPVYPNLLMGAIEQYFP